MRLIPVLIFVMVLCSCSAKQTERFERTSERICDAVDEYEALARGLSDAVIPTGVPQLVIELGLDEAVHQCVRFRKIMAEKDDQSTGSPE